MPQAGLGRHAPDPSVAAFLARRNANAEIESRLRHIVRADSLMRLSTDIAKNEKQIDFGVLIMNRTNYFPPHVSAAVSAFLNECQKEAQPFAISEATAAIRRMFPGLDISDARLLDAVASEASMAGFDIRPGASGPSRTEAQRRVDNDTDGSRRRSNDTWRRNEIL